MIKIYKKFTLKQIALLISCLIYREIDLQNRGRLKDSVKDIKELIKYLKK